VETSERRVVVPTSVVCFFEEAVVAFNVLSCYFIADMLHPGIPLSHLLKKIGGVSFFEEQGKCICEVEVFQPVSAQPDAILNRSSQHEESKCVKISLLIDKHVCIFDGSRSVFRFRKVSLKEVGYCIVLFGIHFVLFE